MRWKINDREDDLDDPVLERRFISKLEKDVFCLPRCEPDHVVIVAATNSSVQKTRNVDRAI